LDFSIELMSLGDIGPWDDYVLGHPDGTLFHLSAWRRAVREAFGHDDRYLAAIEKGGNSRKIVGILPLFRIKSILFGNALLSVPFAELGGILADTPDVESRLMDAGINLAKEMNVDYLELRNRRPLPDMVTKDLYVNFRGVIDPDPDVNLKAIPRKARRMIRQGMKFGLKSEIGDHLLPEFYDLMAKSFHRLGTPIFPNRLLRAFLKSFGNQCEIMVIRTEDGQNAAGVMTFFFKSVVMPYYAGSDFEHRRLAPNDFMYWELMRYGGERGYTVFDFGRSKVDTGSYHFKRHWGFTPEPLSYQYHLVNAKDMPNLSPANPKYKKKVEMWKRLPFPVTKILGPPIARYLG
jgi:FemAB-related protein (PEP-CTERM system-associated)